MVHTDDGVGASGRWVSGGARCGNVYESKAARVAAGATVGWSAVVGRSGWVVGWSFRPCAVRYDFTAFFFPRLLKYALH